MANINYRTVEIPKDKETNNYSYVERRADLLKIIERRGHPQAINQSRIKKKYGVSQSQISHDLKALRDYIKDHTSQNARFITELVYKKSIRKLQQNKQYFKAAKVLNMWNKWLFNSGVLEKSADKVELDAKVETDSLEESFKEFQEVRKGEEDE